MTTTPFGEHLKREREMRGVSLEEISAATRISTRFLEALENERWEQLPGGIFNRGFIRAVAHFLGLDEESLVAEYALATDDKPSVAVWAAGPAPTRTWLIVLLAVILAAILVGGGWLAYRHYAPRFKAGRTHAAGLPSPPAPSPPVAAGNATGEATVGASNSQTAPNAPLDLKVDAGKPSQVKVLADGKVVFDGNLAPGESQRYQARVKFEVSSSEASALLLELNGQIQPPLGPPGQPGSVTLSREDLKKPQNQSEGGRD
jgi:cytoskeleton protein RodZ